MAGGVAPTPLAYGYSAKKETLADILYFCKDDLECPLNQYSFNPGLQENAYSEINQ